MASAVSWHGMTACAVHLFHHSVRWHGIKTLAMRVVLQYLSRLLSDWGGKVKEEEQKEDAEPLRRVSLGGILWGGLFISLMNKQPGTYCKKTLAQRRGIIQGLFVFGEVCA